MRKKPTLLLILLAFTLMRGPAFAEGMPPKVSVWFFYEEPCASCDTGEWTEQFYASTEGLREGIDVTVDLVNMFGRSTSQLTSICERYGVPEADRTLPLAVFSNGTYLSGETALAEKLRDTYAAAVVEQVDIAQVDPSQSVVIAFSVSECAACDVVAQHIAQLRGATVYAFSLDDPANAPLLMTLFTQYGVADADRRVPIVFFAEGYLSGEEAIAEGLQAAVDGGMTMGFAVNK